MLVTAVLSMDTALVEQGAVRCVDVMEHCLMLPTLGSVRALAEVSTQTNKQTDR